MALGTMLNPLNSSMIAVALDVLAGDFQVSAAATTWLVAGYYIASAVGQPVMGKAGDLYGHRRLFFAGVALTLAASIGAPFSHSLVTLVGWRVLQAVGNSTLSPNGIAIVRHHLRQAQGEAFATIAVANNGAAAVGPAVGGVLIHLFGWPAIFLVNVPVAAGLIWIAWRVLPLESGPAHAARQFDWGGTLAFVAGLVGLLAFLDSLSGRPAWWGLALACLAGAGFFAAERRVADPVLDLKLFRSHVFAAVSAVNLLSNLVTYSLFFALPFFLESVRGLGTAATGAYMVAFAAAMAAAAPLAGRLMDRHGPRVPVLGSAVVLLAGLAAIADLGAQTPLWLAVVGMALSGAGLGATSVIVQTACLQVVPRDQAGAASGVYYLVRYLGTITSAAALSLALGDVPTMPGFHALNLALLPIAALALAAGLLVPRGRLEPA